MTADKSQYLREEARLLQRIWPENQAYTICCHGHSIPCGYTAENITKPFDAYPHLFHRKLSERYPHAVISVITTAIGGENSLQGAERFTDTVLNHKPDLITIDYGRNDMFLTEKEMRIAWCRMIEEGKAAGCKLLLITPALDSGEIYYDPAKRFLSDARMAEIITELANTYETGLCDAHGKFVRLLDQGCSRSDFCISLNHINRRAHEIIADGLMEWIPFT